jgi:ribonucleotide monophosphatase NagD (HAD superfamily)
VLGEDLEGIEFAAPDTAGVILLGGAGSSIGYEELDAVFKLADNGVPVVGLHRNVRFQTSSGPALDMGAFIVGLEAAAGIEIPVVGKPAPEFFRAALAELDVAPTEALVVGDDIRADVLCGQAVGMTGVLVRTGKFRPSDLDLDPDYVIGGIADLPNLMVDLM